jgi:hypothetical protein
MIRDRKRFAAPEMLRRASHVYSVATAYGQPVCPGRRPDMLCSPPDGEYKIHIFESVVVSPKSRLAILGIGWDAAPTCQSLVFVISILIRAKALVLHSKVEHFACVIQLRVTFNVC